MSTSIIFAGGEIRRLTLKPRTMKVGDPRCCRGVCGLGDGPKIIPRSEWPKDGVDLSDEVTEILDQDGLELCHSFAGTQANEIAHRLQGYKGVALSAGNLAGQVTGYRDEGASVDQVLAVLQSVGQAPRSLIAQNDYQGRDWPQGWQAQAMKFRIAAAWDCGHDEVFDAIVSCLIYGWPVELGTNAFGGGHAVVATTVYQAGGVWRLAGPNSWGTTYTSWDRPGFWSFPEQQISIGLSGFGAFGIQASVIDPDDVPA